MVQLGSRSPALLATSALSLQELSDGRFLCGCRHVRAAGDGGLARCPIRKPVETTRETIEIVGIVSRGDRLEHPGEIYPLPLRGQQRRCAGDLRCDPARTGLCGAMVPETCDSTGEMADGWLGNAFIPRRPRCSWVRCGKAPSGPDARVDLDLVAPYAVEFHDDEASAEAAARRHADGYAFTIGSDGSGRPQLLQRRVHQTGYGEERIVAELWRAGTRGSQPSGADGPWPPYESCWYT